MSMYYIYDLEEENKALKQENALVRSERDEWHSRRDDLNAALERECQRAAQLLIENEKLKKFITNEFGMEWEELELK